jgi:hypothetical protein
MFYYLYTKLKNLYIFNFLITFYSKIKIIFNIKYIASYSPVDLNNYLLSLLNYITDSEKISFLYKVKANYINNLPKDSFLDLCVNGYFKILILIETKDIDNYDDMKEIILDHFRLHTYIVNYESLNIYLLLGIIVSIIVILSIYIYIKEPPMEPPMGPSIEQPYIEPLLKNVISPTTTTNIDNSYFNSLPQLMYEYYSEEKQELIIATFSEMSNILSIAEYELFIQALLF